MVFSFAAVHVFHLKVIEAPLLNGVQHFVESALHGAPFAGHGQVQASWLIRMSLQ